MEPSGPIKKRLFREAIFNLCAIFYGIKIAGKVISCSGSESLTILLFLNKNIQEKEYGSGLQWGAQIPDAAQGCLCLTRAREVE